MAKNDSSEKFFWVDIIPPVVIVIVVSQLVIELLLAPFYLIECTAKTTRQIPSPDGEHVAALGEVHCGSFGFTDGSTFVSMYGRDRRLYYDEPTEILRMTGVFDLNIRWIDNNSLEVTIPAGLRPIWKETFSTGVEIIYR